MFFSFRLAYYHLLGNPVRSMLTILGMIAASTLVAWTVASYDGALAELDAEEISELLGKYDCFLLTQKNIGLARPGAVGFSLSSVSAPSRSLPPQSQAACIRAPALERSAGWHPFADRHRCHNSSPSTSARQLATPGSSCQRQCSPALCSEQFSGPAIEIAVE